MKSWREILNTPCPRCNVTSGNCIGHDGQEAIGIVHPERIDD